MKKLYMSITVLVLSMIVMLSGCNSNKVLRKLSDSGYFANSYDEAISQTDIAEIVKTHLDSGSNKKVLLFTIDGMRAEGLEYVMGSDLGVAKIAKDGGLYWTKPANIDTKAKIDLGVNFLSIVTGEEPSTFDVLKKTDIKRETPYSIMTTTLINHKVKFVTDNNHYIDCLNMEFKAKGSARLTSVKSSDLNGLRLDCLSGLLHNDLTVVATSNPYNVANGNYKMSNGAYMAAILHLNYYIADIYEQVCKMTQFDWLFIATSTCGGMSKLGSDKEEGNVLTFMLTNKAVA